MNDQQPWMPSLKCKKTSFSSFCSGLFFMCQQYFLWWLIVKTEQFWFSGNSDMFIFNVCFSLDVACVLMRPSVAVSPFCSFVPAKSVRFSPWNLSNFKQPTSHYKPLLGPWRTRSLHKIHITFLIWSCEFAAEAQRICYSLGSYLSFGMDRIFVATVDVLQHLRLYLQEASRCPYAVNSKDLLTRLSRIGFSFFSRWPALDFLWETISLSSVSVLAPFFHLFSLSTSEAAPALSLPCT